MGGVCSAYVLGDSLGGLQWHVFVADADAAGSTAASRLQPAAAPAPTPSPVYTLEVCMTGLCPIKAAQFARDERFMCSAAVTAASGIRALLPGAEIDDYVFEPCGYSMNGIEVRCQSANSCGSIINALVSVATGFVTKPWHPTAPFWDLSPGTQLHPSIAETRAHHCTRLALSRIQGAMIWSAVLFVGLVPELYRQT